MSSNLTKKQWQLCRRLSDRRRNVAATGFVAMTFTIIILGVGRTVDAFGIISMSSEKFSSYQPPVKTSVEQLQKFKSSSLSSNSKRISSSAGYPSSGDRSTAQSASASSLSVPAPPMSILEKGRNSFEQRMRDLVLGPPTTTKNTKRMSTDRRKDLDQSLSQTSSTSLQPNVQRIESLSDYKRIVGDEREKVVAVRFYASYCKVR